ncbi:hypothetical protein C0Q70_11921 [Pomacea canaliculata]|uniref:Uncharacterized protein n=1 Tax=Pomacea canaliculata TaxID=400727 RepID=A0A2T7P7B4_POMCA|nr:PLAC8-like protein 1 [Pomacea canaliculata]XP_025098292.1 PLAC8-like protein 1 [Pomacea canaliculata]XP_025098293.1 PLAC8-like protein 1 [Pomacea canaliculata]XP_025098294.1 PLAC8-like protein 1 [Pomacea canaliculata]PVD29324.1 hypothetical protein C0Q70_11921 [Pomacea canaliculata]
MDIYSNEEPGIYVNYQAPVEADDDYEYVPPPATPSSVIVSQPSTGQAKPSARPSEGGNGVHVPPATQGSTRPFSVNEGKRDWSTDLFLSVTGNPQEKSFFVNAKQAFHDCGCVWCMMCHVARRLGDAEYLPFLPCTGPAVRFKVRIVGGITGSLLNDCLVTSCCWPCAVCQMHRELEIIGI